MSDLNAITKNLDISEDNNSKLTEIIEYLKLKMIYNIVTNINVNKIDVDGNENSKINIKSSILNLQIQNLDLNSSVNPILGLTTNNQLSYNEKKLIKNKVNHDIIKKYTPINNLIQKIKRTYPNFIYNPTADDQEIYSLETERRALQNVQMEKECKTIELLQKCTDIRTSPLLSKEFEMLLSECKVNHIKASTMHSMMLHENCSRVPYISKAIKAVEHDMDNLLNDQDDQPKKRDSK